MLKKLKSCDQNEIKISITFLFDRISQIFFHIQIQHDRFSRFWCIYVLNYDDEISHFNDL